MTRVQVICLLAALDALPDNVTDYYSFDRDAYMRAIDVLGQLGLLPIDVRRIGASECFEQFEVDGVTFTSPLNFTPLTDRPTPITRLALAQETASEPATRPLARSDGESYAQVVPIRSCRDSGPGGEAA